MAQAIATTGIGIVRPEIERLLGQVRAEIEDAADDRGAKGSLQQTPTHLHEIRGVLQALQLSVAARLADEMERVADALRKRRLSDVQGAVETLMLASIQLPGHLDRIEAGSPDLPEGLIDPINELRRVRGDAPLAEEDLLVPLGAGMSEEDLSPELLSRLQRAAIEIRPIFHRALLKWFRGDSPGVSLQTLESIFATLAEAAGDSNLAGMFRVGQAVIRGYGAVAWIASNDAKRLIGGIDPLIRLLTKGEEPRSLKGAADHLLAELLAELSRSRYSDSLTSQIKQRFALPAVPVEKEALDALRAQLSSLDSATRQVLTKNIAEELMPVKDALDLFARRASSDPRGLEVALAPLRSVAKTLTAAGFWALAQRLETSGDTVEEMIAGNVATDGLRLMAIAESIASVEAVLALPGGGEKATGFEQGARIPQGMLKQFVDQALREAVVDLRRAKELFEAYTLSENDSRLLGEIVPLLDRIAGALTLAEREEAGQLLDTVSSCLKVAMLRANLKLQAETVAVIAEAIGSVEYFTESELGNVPALEGVLTRASSALKQLRSAEPGLSLVASPEAALNETHEQEAVATYDASAGRAGVADEEALGSEFLDVFAEEAREEQQAIESSFGRWRKRLEDGEALARLRRAFHTLKGSGRLVGATQVGDLAWAVENLLNRVIEGVVVPGAEVLSYVEEIVRVFPELVEASVSGAETNIELDALVGRGRSLAERTAAPTDAEESLDLLPEATALLGSDAAIIQLPLHGRSQDLGDEAEYAGAPAGEEEPQSETTEAGLGVDRVEVSDLGSEIDTELAAIFRDEASQHLARLRAFVGSGDAQMPSGAIDEDVIRACHTLKGSARIAGFDDVARLATGMEDTFVTFARQQGLLPPGLPDLVKRSVELMEQALTDATAKDSAFGETLARTLEALTELRTVAEGARAVVMPTELPEPIEISQELAPPAEPEMEPVVERGTAGEVSEVEVAEGLIPAVATRGDTAEGGEAFPPPAQHELDYTETAAVASSTEVQAEEELPSTRAAERVAAEARDYQIVESDPALLDAFVQDARDLVDALDDALRQWQREPAELGVVGAVQRHIHTLKGSARLAGVRATGDLCHAFESLLTAVANQQASATETVLRVAQQVGDRLFEQIQAVERGQPVPREHQTVQAIALALEQALGDVEQAIGEAGREEVPEAPLEVPAATIEKAPELPFPAASSASVSDELAAPEATPADEVGSRQEFIRVRADLLNRLVNNAGEINIYRSRLEQQNHTLRQNLTELDQTIARLRNQLRQLEIETEAQILFRYDRDHRESDEPEEAVFDPLELDRFSLMQQLSRSLLETVNDLQSIDGMLADTQREADTLLVQQGRIAADLQHGLLNTRMVPFAQILPRLRRVVRQTAEDTGKLVDLAITGAEGELDRTILDQILAPLEHMLRNGVSHGIEKPDQRVAVGKGKIGRISLVLRREGNDVVISVGDDGGGMNLGAIRAAALAKGLLDANAEVADQELMQLVFESGLSTATEVTQVSGRGVGMDVVTSQIKQLGGGVEVRSEVGKGTEFVVRVPLTLAVTESLLVEAAGEVFAVPDATVESVVRVRREHLEKQLRRNPEEADFFYDGQRFLVRSLGGLLYPDRFVTLGDRTWIPLLLTRSGEHRVALQVEHLVGHGQIVVKPVGHQLSVLRWLSGGTILGDGRVALIVDAMALIRADALQGRMAPIQLEPITEARKQVSVLVVDDSITVRRVTSRLLKRHNMDVLTAKDGVDAMTRLQDRVPDIILLDIEMPRMDGYEFARRLRNTKQLRDIPIIMITSRTGEKHRNYAKEIGVDRYLGKPYRESELIDNINAVLIESG